MDFITQPRVSARANRDAAGHISGLQAKTGEF